MAEKKKKKKMAIRMKDLPPAWLGDKEPSQPNAGDVLSVDA